MSKKTKMFELQGFLVGHPDFPDAQPGDVLKLEVGDDGLPTSELLRQRTRPLADVREAEGAGMSDTEAKGKAKEILDEAKAKAKDIVAKAEADAKEITDKATADATALMEAASPPA